MGLGDFRIQSKFYYENCSNPSSPRFYKTNLNSQIDKEIAMDPKKP